MIDTLMTFGLVIFGIILYAVVTVWKKIKTDGFNVNKFFNSNKIFWAVCMVLALIMAIGINHIDGFKTVIESLGFAIEGDTQAGFVLLGIALALGSDKTKVSGIKELNKS